MRRIEIDPAWVKSKTQLCDAKLEEAWVDAHDLLDQTERAWYTYANLLETTSDRDRAFEVYLKIKALSREVTRASI